MTAISKSVFVALLVLASVYSIKAQSLDENDNLFLTRTIDTFIQHHDKIEANRKTEITILIMEVSTSGKITSIHLLSDENRRSNTYAILLQLKPEVFHQKFERCVGKLIFLPVVTVSGNRNNWGYPDSIAATSNNKFEDQNIVWAKMVYYRMPEYSIEKVNDKTGRVDNTLEVKKDSDQ